MGKAPCSYLSDITLPEGCTNPLDFPKVCQTISLPFQAIEMRFRLSLRCQISLIIYENITMGNLFSKPRSKLKAKYVSRQLFPGPARSSAAQIVTLCDEHGVPVKIQKISNFSSKRALWSRVSPALPHRPLAWSFMSPPQNFSIIVKT